MDGFFLIMEKSIKKVKSLKKD